ncbi:MAG: hypothetical protein Q9162_006744 [Coniocarpon cinnabarinum]
MSQASQQSEPSAEERHYSHIREWLTERGHGNNPNALRKCIESYHSSRMQEQIGGQSPGQQRHGIRAFLDQLEKSLSGRKESSTASDPGGAAATPATAPEPPSQPAPQTAALRPFQPNTPGSQSSTASKAVVAHTGPRERDTHVWVPTDQDVREDLRSYWSSPRGRCAVKDRMLSYVLEKHGIVSPHMRDSAAPQKDRRKYNDLVMLWWQVLLTDLSLSNWDPLDVERRQLPYDELNNWFQEWYRVFHYQWNREKYGLLQSRAAHRQLTS